MALKIVSDAHIPFVEEMFSEWADLDLIPGHEIGPQSIKNADALLVRSVTRIDADLLMGSTVRFVGSATAGLDHVDLDFLNRTGMHVANAPGGNAGSVVEYVLAALFHVSTAMKKQVIGRTLGIVGCGHVGSRLMKRAQYLGLRILVNDPPLERESDERGIPHRFVSLDHLLALSDIVTVHVPLSKNGIDSTEGLISAEEIGRMRHGAWLVNTSRGGVVEEQAVLEARRNDKLGAVVLDVWQGEPVPDPNVLAVTDVATPHIAGYSQDAKRTSTLMIAGAFKEFFDLPQPSFTTGAFENFPLSLPAVLPKEDLDAYVHDLIHQMYAIGDDHRRLLQIPLAPIEQRAEAFRRLRWEFPSRRAFQHYTLQDDRLPRDLTGRLGSGLGIAIGNNEDH